MSKKKKLDISRAIKRKGALTARAKRNGRTVTQQIAANLKSGTKLHKQHARFAKTLKKYHVNVKRNETIKTDP